ncbi:hypothetical protein [Pedobacter sp.]|uniref:hypothetical protein n=1 Tax=Pedobacter sp. TaxID=1411316 RepID=UPI00396CA981
MKTKGINELREQLIGFENDVAEAIAAELKRLGRIVTAEEFTFNPFREDIQPYIDAIRLDNEKIIVDTSFADTTTKYFCDLMSDNEIDHWGMIALLGLLRQKEK